MAQTVTLTASNYNGYNISCFGSQNGSITATVTGGTPPYTYRWSNNATTAALNNVPAGYYSLEVDDADPMTDVVIEEITLTQPEPLTIGEMVPYVYTNGYNVSAYGSCNGTITTTVDGGTVPYTYLWEPGQQTVLSPSNLCANENVLIVTDANGCQINQGISLSEPERDDWTMTGNYNAANKFLGTIDNNDLSIKTYNQERLKIKANGDITINGLAGSGNRLLSVDANGRINTSVITPAAATWEIAGNNISSTDFLGTLNTADIIFRTDVTARGMGDASERMRITANGQINFFGGPNVSELQFIQVPQGNPSGVTPVRRGIIVDEDPGGLFNFYIHSWKNNAAFNFNLTDGNTGTVSTLMSINKNGVVCINEDPTLPNVDTYKLVVGGKVGVREVFVRTSGIWPDFVFDSNYSLMPFEDVVAFYTKHKHLPDMPSAAQIEEQGNYSLGKLQQLQLQKIEELYLYTAQQKSEIEELKKQVAELKALLKK
ncbi:MAG TPA: SprB repeat-containing protein [Bacteroidia bacterium]|nr:SprB repeat-containing protein [Bacteroidia bacterium]HNU33283.1 SprB repeat-containing protein [Bacteroidia bacterium]